jgi:outer membrane protein OmpU
MTNLKKIGLSALAGSLVAFSANAVEMGVSGTAEVTYTTNGGKGSGVTGNPWGSNTAISFSGSGDVGFGTATIVRTLQDGANHGTQTDNFVSAYQTVDMGDLGTLSFDSAGGGLEGVTAYDDLLPTAYEEVWNGVGSGTSYNAGAASNDTIGYSNSFGAFGISLAQTKGGTRATGDGGNGGTVTATTSDWVLTLDGSSLVDGLNGGVMASSASSSLAGAVDDEVIGGWVNYSSGPISVGYRQSEIQSGTAGVAGKNVEAYAVAFNVNDSMSISVAAQDVEFDKAGAAAVNVTETINAVNASYTMGAASMRATVSEASDDAGTAGSDDEHMEISLVLSF